MAAKRGRAEPAGKHFFYPQNRRRTYMGDIRAAPFTVGPATPYLGLWADADTGKVVATVIAIERPAEALAEALVNPTRALPAAHAALDESVTGAVTLVDAYELPGRAIVFDPAVAAVLRPRLASRGVALDISERIDAFDELLTSLIDHMAAAAPPPELDVPDELLAPLCAAAERLWKEKPWRYCYDDPPIGVEPLDRTSSPVYAVVLGRAGQVFGIALYSSLEDYEALIRLDDPPPEGTSVADVLAFGAAVEAAHRHRTYLVSFDAKAEANPAYVDRLVAAGWSRRYRVVPSFVAHGGGKPTALFGEGEARRFGPVLDAVTAFCQQARDRIATIDAPPITLVADVIVGSLGGPRHFRVTMPPDVPTAHRRGRQQRAARGSSLSGSLDVVGATALTAPTTAAPTTSIDDPATTAKLMDALQAHLPIPALATPELVGTLRSKGLKLGKGRSLFIARLFYMGDGGGICCDVTPSGERKEAFVVSLTHLRLAPNHPLYQRVRAYQRERLRRIRASEK